MEPEDPVMKLFNLRDRHASDPYEYSEHDLQLIHRSLKNKETALCASAMVVCDGLRDNYQSAVEQIIGAVARNDRMDPITEMMVVESLQHVSASKLEKSSLIRFLSAVSPQSPAKNLALELIERSGG